MSPTLVQVALIWCSRAIVANARICPGSLYVPGYGNVSFVNARQNTPSMAARDVELQNDHLVPHMWGRTYFGNACAEGRYDHRQYAAFKLLGRTLKYSVNLRSQGCGCNVALYLVSMRQNPTRGGCCDNYCDANSVCGVNCAEIDIQEANMYSWRSTLHVAFDGAGAGNGYGGGRSAFPSGRYGPGAACIDTNAQFQVACSFPVDAAGNLTSMDVELSQNGCRLSVRTNYQDGPHMQQLTQALAEGMTPVASLWKGAMGWLDSPPCQVDNASACPDTTEFFDFSVTNIIGQSISDDADASLEAAAAEEVLANSDSLCVGPKTDCRCARCCQRPGTRCYEKDGYWGACKETCIPGIDPEDEPQFQTNWTCRPLGPKTPGTPWSRTTPSPHGSTTLDSSLHRKSGTSRSGSSGSGSSSRSTTSYRHTARTTVASGSSTSGSSVSDASGAGTLAGSSANNSGVVDLLGPQAFVETTTFAPNQSVNFGADLEDLAETPREASDSAGVRSAREVIFAAQDLV